MTRSLDPHHKARVLFLTAAPSDMTRIEAGIEYREIHARIWESQHRDRCELVYVPEVSARHLASALLRYAPDVVHFSGHGSAAGELLLRDASGRAAPADPVALGELFGAAVARRPIRCVTLNACYSERAARALTAHVDCVVGVPGALQDDVAITFAGALYGALCAGADVASAMRLARAQVSLELRDTSEVPALYPRPGVDPATIHLVVDDLDAPPSTPPWGLGGPPERALIQLRVRCEARYPGAGYRRLRARDVITGAEHAMLFVSASHDVHMAVLQFRADGSIHALTPLDAAPVAAGHEVRLPGKGRAFSFEPPYGPEALFVVASAAPLAGALPQLASALEPPRGRREARALQERARACEVVDPRGDSRRPPQQGGARVIDDPDDDPVVVTGSGLVVYQLSLQSLP